MLREIKRKEIEKEMKTEERDLTDEIKNIIKAIGEEIIKFLLQDID